MGRTLLDLANSLEKKVKRLDSQASEIAVNTALAIIADLVYVTPVDTSAALSNWQVSLETPISNSILAHYPGDKGSTRIASAQTAISAARVILRRKKPGNAIYLSNVLHYIKQLNDGSSAQAPAGFVERAVLIGRRQIKNAKIKL